MGYAVLHLEKAKGADSGISAHIERTIQPKNADPKRTHLNRELIQFPDGVHNRTKASAPRLCADEVMSRPNLIRYQDTYAEQMAAYGLQRGIKGSEAQHVSTHEYYRSLIAQGEGLQANITQLLTKVDEAQRTIVEAKEAKKVIDEAAQASRGGKRNSIVNQSPVIRARPQVADPARMLLLPHLSSTVRSLPRCRNERWSAICRL